jgi:predicted transcriptional regulator
MSATEKTTIKEKLIEFILNLTDEECKLFISVLNETKKEQP